MVDEDLSLLSTLERLHRFLSSQPLRYEIVVVDAGSDDKTVEIAPASENTAVRSNETPDVASPLPTASAPKETPRSPVSFHGNWVKKDPETVGITKLLITQNGSEVRVHAFGRCSPKDCDWGEESGGVVGNSVVITWDQGFVLRKMTLTLLGNELSSVVESVYNDNRPRQRSEEAFVKES